MVSLAQFLGSSHFSGCSGLDETLSLLDAEVRSPSAHFLNTRTSAAGLSNAGCRRRATPACSTFSLRRSKTRTTASWA